jgi:hypothetical protein
VTLASCAVDGDGCFYEMSSTSCSNGACTGAAGAASCCTNACTSGATQCLSGTTLQTCGLSGACTALSSSTCGSGLVCERSTPADCLDPNWAEWPMPNSLVEVSAGAPNQESYTDNGDGTVTDNVTSLMWQQNIPGTTVTPQSFTWSQALAYCPTLALGGHNDWRLPTITELVSLLDYGDYTGDYTPFLNTTAFPNTPPASAKIDLYFWSSTPVAGSPSIGWSLDFNDEFSADTPPAPWTGVGGFVRCVR